MKNKCEYCDSYLSDTQETCPNCGAVNPQYKRTGDGVPRTIEELQKWYESHNLPAPEVTRFFIGRDYRGAKAYGIYRDNDRVIVYKNKADGSRAIRYDGSDEAYAVHEIYLKLKETIGSQKKRPSNAARAKVSKRVGLAGIVKIIIWIMAGIYLLGTFLGLFGDSRKQGYYSYNGNQYYYLDSDWYSYDPHGGWSPTHVDSELSDNSDTYFESSGYSSAYNTSDFSHTDYYSDWQDSQWDDDSNWDSDDSWDSDFGDWDSDW